MDKEEAIKILKDFHDKSALFSVRTAIETLHPELAESEDEKTRKRIIALVNAHGQGMYKEDMLSWLEKQGGKKPTIEMVTPEESLGIDSETYNKIVDECIYGEQKPAEWKQENVDELSEFENAMMHIGYSFFGKRGALDPNDTSSVKVQAQYLLELAQKPAEWSEDDDDDAWMNDIISKVENNLQLNKAEIDWLKSLKQRIGG